MTARKMRPRVGDDVVPGMSVRDMAAALGVSKAEVCRWKKLADISEDDFDGRLAKLRGSPRGCTTGAILSLEQPVPARGRVERAKEAWRGMTARQRVDFMRWFVAQLEGAA